MTFPPPPALTPVIHIEVDVGPLVALDAGTAEGPGLAGVIEPGGVDWQWGRTRTS